MADVEQNTQHYSRGGLADGIIKARLIDVLEAFLEPIRLRRAEYAKDPGEVKRILTRSSERARAIARQTLNQVRNVLGIIEL